MMPTSGKLPNVYSTVQISPQKSMMSMYVFELDCFCLFVTLNVEVLGCVILFVCGGVSLFFGVGVLVG